MPDVGFGAITNLQSFVNSGNAYSDGVPIPDGRTAGNGMRPIKVYQIAGYFAGKGGSQIASMTLDGITTASFGVAAGTQAASTGLQACNGFYSGATTARFTYNVLGGVAPFYYGHGGSGTAVTAAGADAGALGGLYSYFESPSAPTGLAVTITPGQAALNWAAPGTDGGMALTDYAVDYDTNPGFTTYTRVASTPTNKVITGLSAGVTYYFRVNATNAVTNNYSTTSVASSIVSGTMPSAPSAPTAPTATASGVGQENVSWVTPASDGGSAITGYRIQTTTDGSFGSGVITTNVGVVTSTTIAGLTAGATYYNRIAAINAVGTSANSGVASASLGTAPGAPTALTAAGSAGSVALTWAAPASDGGVPISSYTLDRATDSAFSVALSTASFNSSTRSYTDVGLTPATVYYYRVKASNAVGASVASATASAAPTARDVFDIVRGAVVDVDDMQISIRSDGANVPVLTLGYIAFGTASTFVSIATVNTGAGGGQFAVPGGQRNVALVADPAGNLYVIGTEGSTGNLLVIRYARTAVATWVGGGALAQSLGSTGNPIVAIEGCYVAGTGSNPVASILVLARRSGTTGAGNVSFATVDPAAAGGALFLNSGSDPAWLSAPPTGAAANSGILDISALPGAPTRLAIMVNGFAVVDVINGVVTGVSRANAGVSVASPWARVVGVNASTFVFLSVVSNTLSWIFYNAAGSVLGSGGLAGASAQGGAFVDQWDAYYNRVSGLVTVYYVAKDAGARVLESINVSPVTYASTAAVNITSALGAASSTNGAVRVPQGATDERRVVVEAANLLTGVKSTAAAVDTTGNVAPNSPVLSLPAAYDATQAQTIAWLFSDPNSLDAQTAYETQIQRVSDSVNIVATGTVSSAALSYGIVANTLVNGVAYRARVRLNDKLGAVGAWSTYNAFTTAAVGTLTITTPATDNLAGINTSSLNIVWSYTQPTGYVQTSRRVRVIRTSDASVLSDTTMQASTVASYVVTNLPTDVEVRVEVSIVTNAPGTPTVTANRLVTSSYGSPMQPTAVVTIGVSTVTVVVTNPAPVGSRPEVLSNSIDKRLTGTTLWVRVASVARNGVFADHAVKSGKSYDYRIRGVS